MNTELNLWCSYEEYEAWRKLCCSTGERVKIGDKEYQVIRVHVTNTYPDKYYVEMELLEHKQKETKMATPHKHKDVIIAFANGAKIQYSINGEYWEDINRPNFQNNYFYRVKLIPVPVYPEFTAWSNNISLINEILRNFVMSGDLAKYVEKHGTDGLKGQS